MRLSSLVARSSITIAAVCSVHCLGGVTYVYSETKHVVLAVFHSADMGSTPIASTKVL